MYVGTPSSPEIRALMSAGHLVCMTTPSQGNRVPERSFYACDNGKFGKGWPGARAWWAWLQTTVERYDSARCMFATAPDVVGQAEATLTESLPWLPMIRSLGVPAAFVAQDGAEADLVPWGQFDVLFLGGSTAWKVGPAARELAAAGRARGLPVHMGRVNSGRRLKLAADFGCTSVDGTFLAFGPDQNLRRLQQWFDDLRSSRSTA